MRALRLILVCFLSTLLSVTSFLSISQEHQPKGKVIIVLDDVGYRQTDIDAFSLPTEVAFAILPETPHARFYAELANQQGRDVMLHMPMESTSGKSLGPSALTAGMFSSDIAMTIEHALESVPYAIGVNNHMGSELTTNPAAMRDFMQAIKQHSLFFIDSRTTPHSIAYETARDMGVPTDQRHIFLDHEQSEAFYQQQFDRLIRIAKKHGRAIGIAHPYPSSLAYLSKALEDVESLGVELLPVSTFFAMKDRPINQRSRVRSQLIAPSED